MGNGAKAAMKREKNAADAKKGPTSQLKANAAALSIQCVICKQTFMSTTKQDALDQHADSKHKGAKADTCFPGVTAKK